VQLSSRGPLRALAVDLEAGQAPASGPAVAPLPFRWSRPESGDRAASAHAGEQLQFLLSRAVAARRRIRLEYALRASGRTIRRELAPLEVSGAFLSAYCPATRRERAYPLARILAVELLPGRD
jgi:hypothetical protein